MIEFYLGEKPILKNVPTYMGRKPDDLKYILANLKDLVVKGGARRRRLRHAGGAGRHPGEIEAFRQAVIAA